MGAQGRPTGSVFRARRRQALLTLERTARPYPRDLDFHRHALDMSGNPRLVETARSVAMPFQLARASSAEAPPTEPEDVTA